MRGKSGKSKYSLEQVKKIRKDFTDGLNQKQLVEKYSIPFSTIHRLVRNKSYKNDS